MPSIQSGDTSNYRKEVAVQEKKEIDADDFSSGISNNDEANDENIILDD